MQEEKEKEKEKEKEAPAAAAVAAVAAVAGFAQVECPSCRHKVAPRMARCMYCGGDLKPAAAPPRTCPRCQVLLEPETAVWVVIDRCPRCEGEFYDPMEYERARRLDEREALWLQKNLDPRAHDGPAGQALPCPGCRRPMATFEVGDKPRCVVDRCPGCGGFWLDKGEAAALRSIVVRATSAQPGGGPWYGPAPASGLEYASNALMADSRPRGRLAQADLIALAAEAVFDLLSRR